MTEVHDGLLVLGILRGETVVHLRGAGGLEHARGVEGEGAHVLAGVGRGAEVFLLAVGGVDRVVGELVNVESVETAHLALVAVDVVLLAERLVGKQQVVDVVGVQDKTASLGGHLEIVERALGVHEVLHAHHHAAVARRLAGSGQDGRRVGRLCGTEVVSGLLVLRDGDAVAVTLDYPRHLVVRDGVEFVVHHRRGLRLIFVETDGDIRVRDALVRDRILRVVDKHVGIHARGDKVYHLVVDQVAGVAYAVKPVADHAGIEDFDELARPHLGVHACAEPARVMRRERHDGADGVHSHRSDNGRKTRRRGDDAARHNVEQQGGHERKESFHIRFWC